MIEAKLQLEAGGELAVRIRTLRVGDYPAAFLAWEKEDEARLLALVGLPESGDGDLPHGWVQTLSQAGYEQAVGALYEANPGFFGYCVRRAMNRRLRDGGGLPAPSGSRGGR